MAIGTSLAIGLGLAAGSTAGQIYGAKKAAGTAGAAGQIQSDAANRAADLQFRSTQDALNFLREEAQFNRQSQAPYRALGTGAVNTLANWAGIPMTGMTLGSMGQPRNQGGPVDQRGTTPGSMGGQPYQGGPVDQRAMAPGMTLGSMDQTGGRRTVQMQAPDGTVQAVPQQYVAHYERRGARRMS